MMALRPLRVAHVLKPGRFGGLESVVQLLALGLVERGHRVDVCLLLDASDDAAPLVARLEAGGATVHRLVHGNRQLLAERRSLRRVVAALSPDVIHTHGYRADIQAGAVARAAGRPVVSTLHGFTGGGPKLWLYERIQLVSLRRHDLCIAVSSSIAERLRTAKVAAPRIRVLQNAWAPLTTRVGREQALRDLGLVETGEGPPVIGWVGRLSPEKAPDVALTALRRINGIEPRLCFVGDGPLRQSLARTVEAADLVDRVHFAGPQDDAARLFAAFDVLLLSSHTEGTPMVLFEAMDARVPIVATRVGGIPQVLDEGLAWLVEPADPDALARALEAALAHPDAARERAERAREVLAERFSRERWLEAHEALYATLIG